MRLKLKRHHAKGAVTALCSSLFIAGALSSVVIATSSEALALKASPKPAASKKPGKTIVNKPITRSAAQPSPGRTKVPVPTADSSNAPAFAMKMRPANTRGKLATSLPLKRSNANAGLSSSANESVLNFARTVRMGWNSPTPSLGTTFGLAVDGEYIVTAADPIANAWTNSGDIKFYLDNSLQPLNLVGFDLASNVAIFSAGLNARLEKSLNRQRFRFEPAEAGESFTTLTSTGLAGMAKRVSTVADFGATRERFELPNSDLRSTAFLFDRFGRWVATVSPGEKRDGRMFDATTAPQVQDVLRILEMKPPAVVSRSVMQAQSSVWQDRWTNAFISAAQQAGGLRTLNCSSESMKVEDEKFASQLNRTRLVRCLNSVPVIAANDYQMGVELVTGEVNLTEDVRNVVSSDTTDAGLFAKAFYGPKRSLASINIMTVPECEKAEVTNAKQRKIHVRFCTAALKNAQGLSDTTITVVTADTGTRAQVSSLHLKGFDVKNSKKFMEWMIETESIR